MSDPIVLVDGNHLAYRVKFQSQHTFKGWFPDAWAYMYLNSVFMLADKFSPWSDFIVCVDAPVSWRLLKYPAYKKNRKGLNKEASFDDMHAEYFFMQTIISRALPFSVMRHTFAEGDDLIGVLSKKLKNVVIVSSDKDMRQCSQYSTKVIVYDPIKKVYVRSDRSATIDLFLKTCVGDKGDNVPPIVRGVGPKTAEKLLDGSKEMTPEMKRGFRRNRHLIDFACIPEPLCKSILRKYSVLANGDRLFDQDLFREYLVAKHMSKFLDRWPSLCKDLKNYEKGM